MPRSKPAAPHADAFFAAIVNSSSDAIVSKDLDGIVTSWNPAAEKIFGYSAEEMIGQSITLVIPPDRSGEETMILDRIRRGERIEHYETVRRRKDGRMIDISLTISPIMGADGKVLGASKVARDITHRKREQERFRVTLASIGDAVISTDAERRVVFMNAMAEELTGWREADAEGRPIEEVFRIISETTRRPVDSPVEKVLREGLVVGLANHTILIDRKGRERAIDDSAAPIRDGQGGMSGVVLVFRDVTARRGAELSALRLAAIVESSDDAIVGKDLSGRVTSWNPSAERIFGYTADEMIGCSITRVIPPDRLEEEQQILARLQKGERVEHFQTIRLRKDGTLIPVSLTISPILDEEGVVVGASKIARDVTELRNVQKRLEAHAAELEARVRERTAKLDEMVVELEAFSYSLSHDMRAPLRTIQSFCEIVIEDHGGSLPPEGISHLRRAISAASRLDRLVREVLELARLSRAEIVLGPLDLEDLVQDVLRERGEAESRVASIEVRRPLAPVTGHPALLSQCIANLLDNGIKFVAPGVKPVIRICTETLGDRVRVCVTDNGIGINAEGQKKLFELFQRLDSARGYGGTGVGLTIVRRAAERMNGSVGVQSAPRLGSTFWIELPKA